MQTSLFGEKVSLTNVAPTAEYTPLEAGIYTVALVDCEVQQKDYGLNAKVKFRVVEGAAEGRMIFENMIIIHRNSPQAHDIAQRRLRGWCDAIGISPEIESLEPFVGKIVNAKVRVDPGREYQGKAYGPQNRIESFSPYAGAPAASGMSQPISRSTAPAATAALKPAPAAAPQVAPTAADAAPGKKMPWQKAS